MYSYTPVHKDNIIIYGLYKYRALKSTRSSVPSFNDIFFLCIIYKSDPYLHNKLVVGDTNFITFYTSFFSYVPIKQTMFYTVTKVFFPSNKKKVTDFYPV